jgi:TetR/AcrR family transcriptional regulator, transcriptional repressor for nem operon
MNAQQTETLSHKERLLRQGTKLFYAQGFHGTTVDAVLSSAGVPKGSFYHHFGSKDAFGQAVLDRYMQFQSDLFDKWAVKKDLSTADKLTGYFKELSQLFVKSGFQRACLTGKFSTEVAASSDLFRGQLADQIRAWKSKIVELLRQGQAVGDVRGDPRQGHPRRCRGECLSIDRTAGHRVATLVTRTVYPAARQGISRR